MGSHTKVMASSSATFDLVRGIADGDAGDAVINLHHRSLPPYPRCPEPRERAFSPPSSLYGPFRQYEGEALIGVINATRRACMSPKGGMKVQVTPAS